METQGMRWWHLAPVKNEVYFFFFFCHRMQNSGLGPVDESLAINSCTVWVSVSVSFAGFSLFGAKIAPKFLEEFYSLLDLCLKGHKVAPKPWGWDVGTGVGLPEPLVLGHSVPGFDQPRIRHPKAPSWK